MGSRIIYFVTAIWVLLSLGRSFAEDNYPAVVGKPSPEKKSVPVSLPSSSPSPRKGVSPKKITGSCGSLFSGVSAGKNGKTKKSNLPELLQAVEARYAEGKTISSQFTQVQTNALTQNKTTTSGTILFKRPDKVRWHTAAPSDEENLLVGNGKTFWFYTPPFDESEKGQVIIRKSSQVQSKLAQTLLSGAFSEAKGVKIEEKEPNVFLLKFTGTSAGTAQSAEITVNTEEKVVQKVVIYNKGGNQSEITLSQVKVGQEIKDEEFDFAPPAGADVSRD